MLAGEGWQVCFSATRDQIVSIGDRSGDHAGQGSNQISGVSRKIKT